MFVRASAEEWTLVGLSPERHSKLADAPESEQLIELLAKEITSANRIELLWQDAREAPPGFGRARAHIPCSRDLFDWLVNGPSGYRAQYYRSPCVGEAYNRKITEIAADAVVSSAHWQPFEPRPDKSRLSLGLARTKIGLGDERGTFENAPEFQLRVPRWVEHNGSIDHMGLRAPLPVEPVLELIGTWVQPETGHVWQSPWKSDRAMRIHLRGFA